MWNQLLAKQIPPIIHLRKSLVEAINQQLETIFPLFLKDVGLKLKHSHDFQGLNWQSASSVQAALNNKIEAELKAGFSLQGPQRDQYWLEFKNKEPKHFFSQGEYKLAFFCLQMALNCLIKDKAGLACILLLDDLFAEIDSEFSQQITKYILSQPNQLFIVTTRESELKAFKFNSFCFQVNQGNLTVLS